MIKVFVFKQGIFAVGFAMLLIVSCRDGSVDDTVNGYNDFRFLEVNIERIQQGYDDGEFLVTDVVNAFLDRIEKIDRNGPALNSIITVNPEALAIAYELDTELAAGNKRGPMHGIPVVLKDNIDTSDKMPTTAGSRALEGSFPLNDSFVAKKLREAGAVIIGKANLSEWANFRGELSTSGWSGFGGQTRNPYVTDRNPCGSSSGSAVAVSANLAVVAIGTETNGSIVCPSHATGIVGIKPTVGLVSRSGIIPISWSMDIAGPMARNVRDAAITLGVLAGPDPEDQSTQEPDIPYHDDYTRFLNENGIEGKRIGFFRAPLGRNFKVDSLMYEAVEFFKSRGAEIIEIESITAPNTGSHAYRVMLFEYREGLNSYFESLGPGAPVKSLDELIEFNRNDSLTLRYFNQRYLELANETGGTGSSEYADALRAMRSGSREDGIDRVMDEHDLHAIIAPTGSPAWKTDLVNGDSFQLGSSSPAAQAGYPNITLPMGSVDGLPVGLSIFGRAYSEPLLLEIAYSYERGTMHRLVPRFLETD
ncbi:MAG: amidase [Marinilabiliales bacterium]|nr:MAG: amidase [Marinilabiliales bacterium]